MRGFLTSSPAEQRALSARIPDGVLDPMDAVPDEEVEHVFDGLPRAGDVRFRDGLQELGAGAAPALPGTSVLKYWSKFRLNFFHPSSTGSGSPCVFS